MSFFTVNYLNDLLITQSPSIVHPMSMKCSTSTAHVKERSHENNAEKLRSSLFLLLLNCLVANDSFSSNSTVSVKEVTTVNIIQLFNYLCAADAVSKPC